MGGEALLFCFYIFFITFTNFTCKKILFVIKCYLMFDFLIKRNFKDIGEFYGRRKEEQI